jgi:hypothetical protein
MNKKEPNSIESVNPPEEITNSAAWYRLESQLIWYDKKSLHAQQWYKRLKIVQITLAVLIPTMNLLPHGIMSWATAISGGLIALVEAIQHMNQYSTLWITYRSTAEYLKHEKYLFLSNAGPYRNLEKEEQLKLLAERVEEYVSVEHANWFNENIKKLHLKKTETNNE